MIDLNDCETGQHSCNLNTSVCLNTHGSYVCHCISGFEDSVNIFNEKVCKGNLSTRSRAMSLCKEFKFLMTTL